MSESSKTKTNVLLFDCSNDIPEYNGTPRNNSLDEALLISLRVTIFRISSFQKMKESSYTPPEIHCNPTEFWSSLTVAAGVNSSIPIPTGTHKEREYDENNGNRLNLANYTPNFTNIPTSLILKHANLLEIDLSHNSMDGVVHLTEVARFCGNTLQKLNLSYNRIQGISCEFSLPALKHFDLSVNEIRQVPMEVLLLCESIQEINLSCNRIAYVPKVLLDFCSANNFNDANYLAKIHCHLIDNPISYPPILQSDNLAAMHRYYQNLARDYSDAVVAKLAPDANYVADANVTVERTYMPSLVEVVQYDDMPMATAEVVHSNAFDRKITSASAAASSFVDANGLMTSSNRNPVTVPSGKILSGAELRATALAMQKSTSMCAARSSSSSSTTVTSANVISSDHHLHNTHSTISKYGKSGSSLELEHPLIDRALPRFPQSPFLRSSSAPTRGSNASSVMHKMEGELKLQHKIIEKKVIRNTAVKVCVLGNAGVGKSSLIRKLCQDTTIATNTGASVATHSASVVVNGHASASPSVINVVNSSSSKSAAALNGTKTGSGNNISGGINATTNVDVNTSNEMTALGIQITEWTSKPISFDIPNSSNNVNASMSASRVFTTSSGTAEETERHAIQFRYWDIHSTSATLQALLYSSSSNSSVFIVLWDMAYEDVPYIHQEVPTNLQRQQEGTDDITTMATTYESNTQNKRHPTDPFSLDYDSSDDDDDDDDDEALDISIYPSNTSNSSTANTNNDEKLYQHIDINIQSYIDVIQSHAPGSVIVPVCTHADAFDNSIEAARRACILRERLMYQEYTRVCSLQDQLDALLTSSHTSSSQQIRSLRKLLRPASRPKFVFTSDSAFAPAYRIANVPDDSTKTTNSSSRSTYSFGSSSSPSSTGIPELHHRILHSILPSSQPTSSLLCPIPRHYIQVRNLVHVLRRRYKVLSMHGFVLYCNQNIDDDDNNDTATPVKLSWEEVSDALLYLHSIGEVSYYGAKPLLFDYADGYVFLNPRWLVEAIQCLLREDLTQQLRRLRDHQHGTTTSSSNILDDGSINEEDEEANAFAIASNVPHLPFLTQSECMVLWKSNGIVRKGCHRAMDVPQGLKLATSASKITVLEYLQLLLLHYRILIPIPCYNSDPDGSSSSRSLRKARRKDDKAKNNNISIYQLYYLPSLVRDMEEEPGLVFRYKCVEFWKGCLSRVLHLYPTSSNVLYGNMHLFMQDITSVFLQDLYRVIASGANLNTASTNEKGVCCSYQLQVLQLHCWKSALSVLIGVTEHQHHNHNKLVHHNSYTNNTNSNSNSTVVAHVELFCHVLPGNTRIAVSAKGDVKEDGRLIWNGGYNLLLQAVQRVLYNQATIDNSNINANSGGEVLCPTCVAHYPVQDAKSWQYSYIEQCVLQCIPTVCCERGHSCATTLVSGKLLPAKEENERDISGRASSVAVGVASSTTRADELRFSHHLHTHVGGGFEASSTSSPVSSNQMSLTKATSNNIIIQSSNPILPSSSSPWTKQQSRNNVDQNAGSNESALYQTKSSESFLVHRISSVETASASRDDKVSVQSLFASVVLIGLWNGKEIERVGSGFIADQSRGLIVTAAHTVIDIESSSSDPNSSSSFGKFYFGHEDAKIYIGTCRPRGDNCSDDMMNSNNNAVFRYRAVIVAADVGHVDACVLRIITRLDDDVPILDNGFVSSALQEQTETPVNRKIFKSTNELIELQQYNIQDFPELEDSVRILGHNQDDILLNGSLGAINSCADFTSGHVRQIWKKPVAPPTSTTMEISSIPVKRHDPRMWIVLHCNTISGHSGGPCVNRQGEVVGILSYADENGFRCFVVPTKEWQSLLRTAKYRQRI